MIGSFPVFPMDPDAMAQAEADKAQDNIDFKETAKSGHSHMRPNKYGIAIEITGKYLMQDDPSIGYKIQGYSEKGEFETIQTYLDFVDLREKLTEKWFGCTIPPLLPSGKKWTNQYEAGEARVNAMDKFLKGIAEVPDLYNSDDFQEFLKSEMRPTLERIDSKQGSEMIKPIGNINVIRNSTQLYEKIESVQSPQILQQKKIYHQEHNNSQNNHLNYSQQNNYSQNNLNYSQQNNSRHNNMSHSQQNNQSQIKSIPPRNQNQNPSITIIGDFQRVGSFGGMHKEYHIRGYDANGMFEVNRRYSDFKLIKEILVNNFPEVKFRELPRRFRYEGDNEEAFQKERSKGLIDFLQSITQIDPVFHSPEWQAFIKDPSPKIADKLKSFKKGFFSKIFGK